jgi:hypothetical protein
MSLPTVGDIVPRAVTELAASDWIVEISFWEGVSVDNEKEIKSLLAETIAVQTVLVHVLRRLAKSDTNLWKAIAAGFDDAVSEVESVALQHGAEANSESTLEALRIVEIHRKASLGAGLLADTESFETGDKSEPL